MDENMNNQEQQTQQTEEIQGQEQAAQSATKEPQEQKTFTREELNRAVASEKKKAAKEAVEQYQRQQEAQKQAATEAEKFAKLRAEEQVQALQERIAAMEKEKAEMQQLHEADKLRQLALEKAAEVKLPAAFLSDLDYRSLKADELDELITGRLDAFNAAVEERLNTILPNRTPKTSVAQPDPAAWQKPAQPSDNRKPWERFTRR